MADNIKIKQQIQTYRNSDPKLKNLSDEQVASIMIKDGTLKLTAKQRKTLFSAKSSTVYNGTTVEKKNSTRSITLKSGKKIVIKNGQTHYYASDGVELNQKYFEKTEGKIDVKPSGRYSVTKNGQTKYYAANGTELNEKYFRQVEVNNNVVVKNSKGDAIDVNKKLQNKLSKVSKELKHEEENQGWMGKIWSGTKNLFAFGDSSDKVRKQLKQEQKLLKQFNEQPQNRAKLFKNLTGLEYNKKNLQNFADGKIQLKSEINLNGYKEGQKIAVDVGSDIISGVTSFGVYSAAIAAAPFTGGASITLGAAAAGIVGAGTKAALKYSETIGTDKKYDSLGHDLLMGAANGIISTVTAGLGGAVGKTVATRLGLDVVKAGAKEVAKQGTKQVVSQVTKQAAKQGFKRTLSTGAKLAKEGLKNPGGYKYVAKDGVKNGILKKFGAYMAEGGADGALSGGAISGIETAHNGGNAEDIKNAVITGTISGAFMGGLMNWGMNEGGSAAGKLFKGKKETIHIPNQKGEMGGEVAADAAFSTLNTLKHQEPPITNTSGTILPSDGYGMYATGQQKVIDINILLNRQTPKVRAKWENLKKILIARNSNKPIPESKFEVVANRHLRNPYYNMNEQELLTHLENVSMLYSLRSPSGEPLLSAHFIDYITNARGNKISLQKFNDLKDLIVCAKRGYIDNDMFQNSNWYEYSDGLHPKIRADIDKLKEAERLGIKPIDMFIPKTDNRVNLKPGDMFADRSGKVYILDDRMMEHYISVDRETLFAIMPPVGRYFSAQNMSGTCFNLSAYNALLNEPKVSAHVMRRIHNENGNIVIRMAYNTTPSYNGYDKNMFAGKFPDFHKEGCIQVKLSHGKYISKDADMTSHSNSLIQALETMYGAHRKYTIADEYIMHLKSRGKDYKSEYNYLLKNMDNTIIIRNQKGTYKRYDIRTTEIDGKKFRTADDYYKEGGWPSEVIDYVLGGGTQSYSVPRAPINGPTMTNFHANLRKALSRKTIATFATLLENSDKVMIKTDRGLAYQHAYAIINYNPKTDIVTYINPWNSALTYEMPLPELTQYMSKIELRSLEAANGNFGASMSSLADSFVLGSAEHSGTKEFLQEDIS